MRCQTTYAPGFGLLLGALLAAGPRAGATEPVTTGRRSAEGSVAVEGASNTVAIRLDQVRAFERVMPGAVTRAAAAAAGPAGEKDTRAAREAPPPGFRDVRIERPFDAHLRASPLLMELGGAAVVDAGRGEALLVGVARVGLTDGSAADLLRAERVGTLKARAAAVGERDGVRITYLKRVEDRVVVVADAGGEKARAVSDRLTVTREAVEGVAKGLPVVGRWRSADGTVVYLAVGSRLTGSRRTSGNETTRTRSPAIRVAPAAGRWVVARRGYPGRPARGRVRRRHAAAGSHRGGVARIPTRAISDISTGREGRARRKLNQLHATGAVLVAGRVGMLFQSWWAFAAVLSTVVGLYVWGGNVRPARRAIHR